MLDLTRKYTTRDGREVRDLRRDKPGLLVGSFADIRGGAFTPYTWHESGRRLSRGENPLDLIPYWGWSEITTFMELPTDVGVGKRTPEKARENPPKVDLIRQAFIDGLKSVLT